LILDFEYSTDLAILGQVSLFEQTVNNQ